MQKEYTCEVTKSNKEESVFECSILDENEKCVKKFSITITDESIKHNTSSALTTIIDDNMYGKCNHIPITYEGVHRELSEMLAQTLFVYCGDYKKNINYSDFCSFGPPDTISTLMGDKVNEEVFETFNLLYKPDDKQMDEIKTFWRDGLDLDLVIQTDPFYGKLISGDEMQKIRYEKYKEWGIDPAPSVSEEISQKVR